MDWKYKRFDEEKTFREPPELVARAARAVIGSLKDWQITDTPDGFEAKGGGFSHSETAKFRIEPISSGTKITVTVFVQRAGAYGFMLFDAGGFYNGQIRRWLENIERHLQQGDSSTVQMPKNGAASKFLIGCFGLIFAVFLIYWLVQSVYAAVGLFTGSLYLLPARSSHEITMHGIWARIVSAIILLFNAFLVFLIFKSKKYDRQRKL